ELTYSRESRRLSLWGGSRKDSMLGEVLKAVCDILADCPDLSGYAIEQRACMDGGHPRQNVRDAIKKGIADGLIATRPGPRNATLHYLVDPNFSSPQDQNE